MCTCVKACRSSAISRPTTRPGAVHARAAKIFKTKAFLKWCNQREQTLESQSRCMAAFEHAAVLQNSLPGAVRVYTVIYAHLVVPAVMHTKVYAYNSVGT